MTRQIKAIDRLTEISRLEVKQKVIASLALVSPKKAHNVAEKLVQELYSWRAKDPNLSWLPENSMHLQSKDFTKLINWFGTRGELEAKQLVRNIWGFRIMSGEID